MTKDSRATSNGYPGIKTQQITSGKASGLLSYNGLNSTSSGLSYLRNKNSTTNKAPSFRVQQNKVLNIHGRHFKSHSNTSGDGTATPQEVAPLRVNTNFTNVSNPIQINNLNAKNKNFAKEDSKTASASENLKSLRTKSQNKGGIPMPKISITVTSNHSKNEKLVKFRERALQSEHDLNLKDQHECLQQKELLENARKA